MYSASGRPLAEVHVVEDGDRGLRQRGGEPRASLEGRTAAPPASRRRRAGGAAPRAGCGPPSARGTARPSASTRNHGACRGVGAAHDLLRGLDEAAVELVVLPLEGRDPPARLRARRDGSRGASSGAFFERWSQNFSSSAPSLASICSKKAMRPRSRLEVGGPAPAVGPPHEGSVYQELRKMPMRPRAGRARQKRQIRRALPLLVGGRAEGVGLEAAGIEPLVEALDGLALARPRRPPRRPGSRGPWRPSELELRLEEARAELGELASCSPPSRPSAPAPPLRTSLPRLRSVVYASRRSKLTPMTPRVPKALRDGAGPRVGRGVQLRRRPVEERPPRPRVRPRVSERPWPSRTSSWS